MGSLKLAAAAALLGALVLPAQAASVSYYLDQSNALPDGANYLQVDIADGAGGAIDFTVQVLSPLSDIATSKFGIRSFALNVVPGGSAEAMNISGLPTGWFASDSVKMDGFGRFDIRLQAWKGKVAVPTLTFSITGIDGDRPEDYAIFSTGNAPGDHQFFAAKVGGFEYCEDSDSNGGGGCNDKGGKVQAFAIQSAGAGNDGRHGRDLWATSWKQDLRHGMHKHWDGKWAEDCITSGVFAGSTAVPLPGTAWRFLAGAAGVISRARRRTAAR